MEGININKKALYTYLRAQCVTFQRDIGVKLNRNMLQSDKVTKNKHL